MNTLRHRYWEDREAAKAFALLLLSFDDRGLVRLEKDVKERATRHAVKADCTCNYPDRFYWSSVTGHHPDCAVQKELKEEWKKP